MLVRLLVGQLEARRMDSETPPLVRAASARIAVLAFRLTWLAAALALAVGGTRIATSPAQRADTVRYVCPMHPEVTASEPGLCPVCRMELEPMADATGRMPAIRSSAYQTYEYVRRRGFGRGVDAPAWVEGDGSVAAVLYDDEIAGITPEEPATFVSSDAEGGSTAVRLDAETQPQRWDPSTSVVRFHSAATIAAKVGVVGWLRMASKRRDLVVVPRSSVLQGDEGAYVLVATPEGALASRLVTIGRVIGDYAVILSGLRTQERVSVRSAFVLDAERRLRRGGSIEVAP